jgi:hypothetical protein
MVLENVKSVKVTALEAKPYNAPDYNKGYGVPVRKFLDEYTVGNTTSTIDSTYKACLMPSNAKLVSVNIRGDGTVDQPDIDAGLYHLSDAGVETEYDGVLATALDIDDTGDHFAYGNVYGKGDGGGNNGDLKALWELAGLTSDPGGRIGILMKNDAANVALGKVTVICEAITD